MALKLAPRDLAVEKRGDAIYLRSRIALAAPPARLGDLLRRAAARAPDRDFLIERSGPDELRRITYAAALRAAEGIADWLVREQPADARVVALSGNSVDHALLMLGCFLAGVPFVPVSPAYSLLSQDFAKLRTVIEKIRPSVIFVDAIAPFQRALDAIAKDARVVDGAALAALAARAAGPELVAREATITADHVAKILFTSGSTAFPKGVPNTHRMLCSNQQMIAQLWPFLVEEESPVFVDWLPWSHTFGGNHNFNMALMHLGTLFVDDGKPTPAGIEATVRNLRALSPTLYFNVPAGFAALVPRLEADPELRSAFFARLRVIFYAAAALPANLWARLVRLAEQSGRPDVFMTTAWGSTETSPLATSTHFVVPSAGNIGLPAPGVELKLVPNGNKVEVRVKGPNVMTGYLDEPALTVAAFDEEGFYRMGDAVRFAEDASPESGLLFDGRVSEDFKLASGTWVSVTNVRTGIVARAGGILADVVVCGHDRDELGLLAWPSVAGCRELAGGVDHGVDALSVAEVVREHVREVLLAWNAEHPGSSTRIARALLLGTPPCIDAGEITDKGYTNQRLAIEKRADAVRDLFAAAPDPGVIVLRAKP